MNDGYQGILKLQELLGKKAKAAQPENLVKAQEQGAVFLADKLRGRSAPRKTGAMLDSFAYKTDPAKGETIFGWTAKYFYGRLKESGHTAGSGRERKKSAYGRFYWHKKTSTSRVKAQPHLKPTFEENKQQIFQIMIDNLERG